MYGWFKEELATIKTPRFHLLGSQMPSAGVSVAQMSLSDSLPPSFTAFLSEFGDAKLFRWGNYYLLIVYGFPQPVITINEEKYLNFGNSSRFGQAYFQLSLLNPGKESPVFELDSDDTSKIERTSENFESWFEARYSEAKQNYNQVQWKQILEGPHPFTPAEENIIMARRAFKWEVVGRNNNGNTLIKIRNESDLTLPYLSLGVRAKDRTINGIVRLPVSQINPGEEQILECDCYKKLITPQNMEIHQLDDPQPEDRELYWEFRTSH